MKRIVVYTDLDGTLLDHDSYSWQPAAALLQRLRDRRIPVIPCTSKTRAELLPLRDSIGLNGPFIVENGAAVVLPEGFQSADRSATFADAEGYRVRAFVDSRSHWLSLIEDVYAETGRVARGFSEMSAVEIAELTGLSLAAAERAAAREYGEPLQWLGGAEQCTAFIDAVLSRGGVVLQGGRFAHVSGQSDKGRALSWLQEQYAVQWGQRPISIAAGDSHNDIAMLETADWAVRVRSPSHEPPALRRTTQVITSTLRGPAGWAEGLTRVLAAID